jgi:hypothetical protein
VRTGDAHTHTRHFRQKISRGGRSASLDLSVDHKITSTQKFLNFILKPQKVRKSFMFKYFLKGKSFTIKGLLLTCPFSCSRGQRTKRQSQHFVQIITEPISTIAQSSHSRITSIENGIRKPFSLFICLLVDDDGMNVNVHLFIVFISE